MIIENHRKNQNLCDFKKAKKDMACDKDFSEKREAKRRKF